jgi:hypothetical protein
MSAIAVSAIAFGLIGLSTALGMALRSALPEHHLSSDSKDVIRLATAMIATLAAIVLGMLISSTRSSYEQASGQIDHLAAGIIELDVRLEEYGPQAAPIRKMIRDVLIPMTNTIWRDSGAASGKAAPSFRAVAHGDVILLKLEELTPQNPVQRSLQARTLQIAADLAQTRLLLFSRPADSISGPFLIVLVMWLAVIFGSFGIFTSPNVTVVTVLVVCALSASSAIFLILEMAHPFDGLMQISSEPLRNALAPLAASP